MDHARPARVVTLAIALVAALLLFLALMPGAPAGIARAQQSAPLPGRSHKVVAPPNLLDTSAEGVRLLEDYGAYHLLRLTPAALSQLPLRVRRQVRLVDDFDTLQIDAYPFNPLATTPELPRDLAAGEPDGPALHLVQFVGPIKDDWLQAVRAAGAIPIHYVAHNAYLLWADAPARANLAALRARDSFVQYSAPYQPYFKLGLSLRDRLLQGGDPGEVVPVTIQVYDHAGKGQTRALIEGWSVVAPAPWSPILAYENTAAAVRAGDLPALAQRPDVVWIGERFSRELLDEVQGQILAGDLVVDANANLGPAGPGYLAWLDGLGFSQNPADYPILDITDDGLGDGTLTPGDATLYQFGDFANPSRLAYVQNCTATPGGGSEGGHGHINASIAGGYDQRTGFPFQDPLGYRRGLGINPYGPLAGTRVFAPSFDLTNCGGSDTGLIQASYSAGARISSNSWGCPFCAGQYDASSQAFDLGSRDADLALAGNQQFLFLFASGNSGPWPGTIGTPGNAKNVVTVGASENVRPEDEDGPWFDGCFVPPELARDAFDVTHFSSRGPAPGGRIKPDLIAPGTHVQGTASPDPDYDGSTVCDPYHPAGQSFFAASSGTSHSTPAVAGAASLVYWWLQNRVEVEAAPPGYEPSPAAVKAYLLTHVTRVTHDASFPDSYPNDHQGFGLPDLARAFDQAPRYILDQSVRFDNSGETWTFEGTVGDPSRPVRIMLAYTDQAGQVGTSPQVNDLDLAATVAGVDYLGNHFEAGWSVPGGSPDPYNNVEAVFVPAGADGIVRITVTAFNMAGDGVPNVGDATDQDFALVCYNCRHEPDFVLDAVPDHRSICAPGDAAYNLAVDRVLGYQDPVTLGASGAPAGATVTFSPNPVTPPSASVLTIGDTAAAPVGHYDLALNGLATTRTHTVTVGLDLFDAAPALAQPFYPLDGALYVDVSPTFRWQPPAQGKDYALQVATDAGFANLVYTATITDVSPFGGEPVAHSTLYNVALQPLTTYYWRLRSDNLCGSGAWTPAYTFTTRDVPPMLLVDDDDDRPDILPYYTAVLDALGAGYDLWDTGGTDAFEPFGGRLALYDTVVWFTGAAYGRVELPWPGGGDVSGGFAGPGPEGEAALAGFLDGGGCLFLSSQNYLDDHGKTDFMLDYLGVDSSSLHGTDYITVTGQGSLYGGLGPYPLDYPFGIQSDWILPDATAQLAFIGDDPFSSQQWEAGVLKLGGVYTTTYLGFPLEAIADTAARTQVLEAFLSRCHALEPAGTLSGTVTDLSTGLPIAGATVTSDNGSFQRTTAADQAGAYQMLLPAGIYDFTAAAPDYGPVTSPTITIVTGTVTTLDFVLDGPRLVVDTLAIEDSMGLGQTTAHPVTLDNVGSLTLTFEATTTHGTGPFALRQEIVSDGGFELGTPNPAWDEFHSEWGSPLCNTALCGQIGSGPHGGAYWALLGGTFFSSSESYVQQSVTIPSGDATLTFYLEIPECDSAADYLQVLVDDQQVFYVQGDSPLCGQLGYALQSVDLTAFADGAGHTLKFYAVTWVNNFGPTSFNLDDIAIESVPHGGHPRWAYALPPTGTIPPGGNQVVDLIFDSTTVTELGTYAADLEFLGDFVNDVDTVPLTMHLICDACGYLAGTITDAETGLPLAADLQVAGPGDLFLTLNTSSYALTVPPGAYDLAVGHAGYYSQTASVAVTQGLTTTTDFALVPIQPLRFYYLPLIWR